MKKEEVSARQVVLDEIQEMEKAHVNAHNYGRGEARVGGVTVVVESGRNTTKTTGGQQLDSFAVELLRL